MYSVLKDFLGASLITILFTVLMKVIATILGFVSGPGFMTLVMILDVGLFIFTFVLLLSSDDEKTVYLDEDKL